MEKIRREKIRDGESQKREDAGARKGRKSANIVFSGGSKSRLTKAAGAEPDGQMRDEKLHAVIVGSTFGSKICQKLGPSAYFDVSDVVLLTDRWISK